MIKITQRFNTNVNQTDDADIRQARDEALAILQELNEFFELLEDDDDDDDDE